MKSGMLRVGDSDKWHQIFIAIWHDAALAADARAIWPMNGLSR